MPDKEIAVVAICLLLVGGICGCVDNGNKYRLPTTTNHSPIAWASANPTSGYAPLKVSFTGSGTDEDGSIVSYHWDFDDGAISDIQNPTHTFQVLYEVHPTNRYFFVTLTVTDNDGATGSDSITITVSPSHLYKWVHIASYSGDSTPWNTITDAFTITGSKFKVEYTVHGDPERGYWNLVIYPEGETLNSVLCETVDLADYDGGRVNGWATIHNAWADAYYCDIVSADIDEWTVDIYDWR